MDENTAPQVGYRYPTIASTTLPPAANMDSIRKHPHPGGACDSVCGIIGGYGGMDPETARRMMGRVAHRGPDDDGLVEVAGNVLGHRRLSIVDVEGGKQPLVTPDGSLYLVGNGEVYNHEEIRGTLKNSDLKTRSDNEVALCLVAERGPDALAGLLGMYAFLMAGEDGTFIAARDPVGIKPLYWAQAEARGPAEHLGTELHESPYTEEDALNVLPEVVRIIESFDPSLVRSAVPNFILAEFTARHVKVVLTGEGADEIFAGYEYLEEFRTEEELHAELVRTIKGLHDLNLQRADRVTMAHGLEARVPFLELDMISLGLSLPAGWKLAGEDQPEKRLLKMAFEGWLPDDFLWRKKAQFGDGSGAA